MSERQNQKKYTEGFPEGYVAKAEKPKFNTTKTADRLRLLFFAFLIFAFFGVLRGGGSEPSSSAVSGEAVEKTVAFNQVKIEQGNPNLDLFTEADKDQVFAVALVLCKDQVKKQLASPASADFPWTEGKITLYSRSQTAVLSSYVDAQNGFGVIVRANYACTIKFGGGEVDDPQNWRVDSVVIL